MVVPLWGAAVKIKKEILTSTENENWQHESWNFLSNYSDFIIACKKSSLVDMTGGLLQYIFVE